MVICIEYIETYSQMSTALGQLERWELKDLRWGANVIR